MKRAALVLSLLILGCGASDDTSGQNGPLGGMENDKLPMDERPPGPMPPMAAGTVPHFIDADTGEDLGPVLDYDNPTVFSPKLNAPLDLDAETRTYFPLPDCKGNKVAIVYHKRPHGAIVHPTYLLDIEMGTYLRLAGKPVGLGTIYYFETKFGEKLCKQQSAGVMFDEFTDTGVRGKLYSDSPNSPNKLKVELR